MVLFANYETFVIKNEEKKNKVTGGKRVMYTSHHPCWDAKNRFGLPEKLPFDFAQIAHCFNNVAPPVVQQPTPQHPPVQQVVAENPTTETSCVSQPMTQNGSHSDAVAIDASIPPALRQLMEQNKVSEADIRRVVAQRGYYPENTPIQNYDPQFISGVLVGAWAQVYKMIKGA